MEISVPMLGTRQDFEKFESRLNIYEPASIERGKKPNEIMNSAFGEEDLFLF